MRATLIKLRLACQLFLALQFTFPQLASAAALINDGMISGAISIVSEQDTHTFTANADENVLLRIVDTSGTYTVIVSDDSGNHDETGNYTHLLTGTGITSSDNPGFGSGDGGTVGGRAVAVPLPDWALVLLAI
jgi:hypothetical protein